MTWRTFNDRLLLGLKGTMSEAQLHFLAGRLQRAKRAAAERGELRFPLPVGYVYDDEGTTVVDPDAEVQAAVADVFVAFRAGGSAYQVAAASLAGRCALPPRNPRSSRRPCGPQSPSCGRCAGRRPSPWVGSTGPLLSRGVLVAP
jgi:DNA invertase Pin-like site-specific DNA recombinase